MHSKGLWLASMLLLVALFFPLLTSAVNDISEGVPSASKDTMNYLMLFQNIPKAAPFLALKMKEDTCRHQLLKYKDDIEGMLNEAQNVRKPTEQMVKLALCKMETKCIAAIGGLFRMVFGSGGMTEVVARQYFGGKGVDLQKLDKLLATYAFTSLCHGRTDTEPYILNDVASDSSSSGSQEL